jgi:hypothetical protein
VNQTEVLLREARAEVAESLLAWHERRAILSRLDAVLARQTDTGRADDLAVWLDTLSVASIGALWRWITRYYGQRLDETTRRPPPGEDV